jgi:FAD-dependent oxidoreductase family protein
MKFSFHYCWFSGFIFSSSLSAQTILTTDVLVVGGGTGGIAAGIQSARSGSKTIIVEKTHWLGGMLTAAGVSCTDGNDLLPGGMWQEFRQALYTHYRTTNLASGWVSETCFEPHAGDSIFKAWAAKEENLKVLYGWAFEKVEKKENKITGAVFKNEKQETLIVNAKITIDATELGDVFANAGAEYDIGTEDSSYANEKMAPGKTNIIQDLTWVAILKDYGLNADKTILMPPGYDLKNYYCSCTSAPCADKPYNVDAQTMLNYAKLPHNKYMINWPAHGNDSYVNVIEDDAGTRNKKYESARLHTLGFVYFIQTTLGFKNLGLADDELDNGIAFIPYNREGRRMKGVVRFNINHILDPYKKQTPLYRTGIAVGDYPVDHHHGQNPQTPFIDFPKIPSFNIPMGALIPDKMNGLIVCEKGISVSNIVNGATRLQPVVLLTGQAAGILASLCAQHNLQPRDADIRTVQQKLLDEKSYIMPFVDVKPESPFWQAVQRAGATGILKGFGKAAGWENKTFFYPDSTISVIEFEEGIKRFDSSYLISRPEDSSLMTMEKAMQIIISNGELLHVKVLNSRKGFHAGYFFDEPFWKNELGLSNFNMERNIKRYELAVLLNYYTNIFSRKHIDFNGF